MCIGNVRTGLARCEKHKRCVECLNKIDRRTQSTDECFYCPIAEGCSWCSAYNYQVYGTADKRVTKICPMHKGRILANMYLKSKVFAGLRTLTADADQEFENQKQSMIACTMPDEYTNHEWSLSYDNCKLSVY